MGLAGTTRKLDKRFNAAHSSLHTLYLVVQQVCREFSAAVPAHEMSASHPCAVPCPAAMSQYMATGSRHRTHTKIAPVKKHPSLQPRAPSQTGVSTFLSSRPCAAPPPAAAPRASPRGAAAGATRRYGPRRTGGGAAPCRAPRSPAASPPHPGAPAAPEQLPQQLLAGHTSRTHAYLCWRVVHGGTLPHQSRRPAAAAQA